MKFLLNYRNTPTQLHRSDPSQSHDEQRHQNKTPLHQEAIDHSPSHTGPAAKVKQKEYADRQRKAKERKYKVGDKVLIHQKKTTTKPPYNPDPTPVMQIKGTQITATRRGQQMTRNVDKWKILKDRPLHLRTLVRVTKAEYSDSDDDFDPPAPPQQAPAPAHPHQALAPIPPHQQDPPQHQVALASPAPQQQAPKTPQQGPWEVWQVAHRPWRDKKTDPSPRREKRYSR